MKLETAPIPALLLIQILLLTMTSETFLTQTTFNQMYLMVLAPLIK